MDYVVAFIALCVVVLMCAVAWIVVTPHIHEGLVIKCGLIMLALGLFGLAVQIPLLQPLPGVAALLRAMAICCAGLLATVTGLAWRIYRQPQARDAVRVMSGWTPLDGAAE